MGEVRGERMGKYSSGIWKCVSVFLFFRFLIRPNGENSSKSLVVDVQDRVQDRAEAVTMPMRQGLD